MNWTHDMLALIQAFMHAVVNECVSKGWEKETVHPVLWPRLERVEAYLLKRALR